MAKFYPFLFLDCASVLQRSVAERAIVQNPEGPKTYDIKIWLEPSGNHGTGPREGTQLVGLGIFLGCHFEMFRDNQGLLEYPVRGPR